jgi:hypothetical protein
MYTTMEERNELDRTIQAAIKPLLERIEKLEAAQRRDEVKRKRRWGVGQ